ncbi:MAG: family penicillin-binding protein [Candidatus Peribacteria bacterium]|nr:family penicillin-binding protein [Candidatus Peribacteria bacterium]
MIDRIAKAFGSGGRWLIHTRRSLGWWQFLLRSLGIFIVLFIAYLGFLWLGLPNVRDPNTFRADQSTVITDRNGVELYRVFSEQDRTIIPSNQLPVTLKNALISIEDARFYEHGCLDPKAILRAALSQFIPGLNRSGGSTLAQQLALNALLKRDHSLTRKLREAMLACELEHIYTKDEVLALYLNWVPFGPSIYGAEQASKQFFGKSAKDLTLAESAVLASLPQRPTYLNPYGSHVRTTLSEQMMEKIASGKVTERSQIPDKDVIPGLLGNTFGTGGTVIYIGGRSDQVLKNMQDQKHITEAQRLAALQELGAKQFKPARQSLRAAHYTLWVRDQVDTMFKDSAEQGLLEQGGLTIQTTLDWKLQQMAETIIAKHKDDIAKRYGARNISLVAMDPKTNEILAYVGNADYNDKESGGKIDMAQVPRQPGSSFKPIVYASAFERGYGPATVLYDVQTKFGQYEPQNYEGGFWGLTSIRRALAGSRNIPAIKAYFLAGQQKNVLDVAERLGAPTPKKMLADGKASDYGPSLALGGGAEVPLVEMVHAYATFADYGHEKAVKSILKITDRNKALIPMPGASSQDNASALDPRIAYEITSILSDVSARPTEFWQSALTVPGFQAAAKTGTSNKCNKRKDPTSNISDCIDSKPNNLWTIGYTPNLVVGVWVGNADSTAMPGNADGLNVAAPVWKEFMIQAHKILPNPTKNFEVPEGIVQPQISLLSGELPTDCTPVDQRRSDIFLKENAPTKADPGCMAVEVDKLTGLLASDSCPVDGREMRSFISPLNITDSRITSGILRQWQDGISGWAGSQKAGTGGSLSVAPTEKCDISKTPGRMTQPTLQILVPVKDGIATYPALAPLLDYKVGSGVLSVEYMLDDKVIQTVTSAPFDPVLRIPRSVDQSGSHTLKVTLTDTYYNKVSDSVTFRFEEDLQKPAVNFLIPSNDISIRKGSTLHTQIRATDEGGIKYVELYMDSQLLVRLPKPPFEFDYKLDVPAGSHVLRAVGTDFGGNTAESSINVTVEE